MKGRSNRTYTSKTLLNAWRQILENWNVIKADPATELDPVAMAEVSDVILDRIDAYRPIDGRENAAKVSTESAQFASRENRPHNRLTARAK